jgi:hypothetical protein
MSLPSIRHKKLLPKNYVYNVIDGNSATYHTLETSIRHVEDPKYCSFFNIIRCWAPMEKEISSVLNNCYIDENLIE